MKTNDHEEERFDEGVKGAGGRAAPILRTTHEIDYAVREARKALIAVVQDWRLSGQSVDQLLFRMRTCDLRQRGM